MTIFTIRTSALRRDYWCIEFGDRDITAPESVAAAILSHCDVDIDADAAAAAPPRVQLVAWPRDDAAAAAVRAIVEEWTGEPMRVTP